MADHELVSTQLPDHDVSGVLSALADVIESRKGSDPQKSYVAKLFSKAPDGVLKKIGEEAVECVMAAKDENKKDIIYETADLWFHSLVMLSQYGLRPDAAFVFRTGNWMKGWIFLLRVVRSTLNGTR